MATIPFYNKRVDNIQNALSDGKKVVIDPDGNPFAIDASELEPAVAGGWREVTQNDVDVFRQSQQIEIPDENIDRINNIRNTIQQGKYIVSNDTGDMFSIDETEMHDASAGGWKVWTPQEITNYVKEIAYGGPGGTALAATAGAARGFSMGVSDLAITKPLESSLAGLTGASLLGIPGMLLAPLLIENTLKKADAEPEEYKRYKENMAEKIKGLQETNPVASIAGEIGGGLLPALFTGGASTGVTAANEAKTLASATNSASKILKASKLLEHTPINVLTKAGQQAEKMVLGKTLSPSISKKLAASMARGASEAGIYSASLEASRIAMENDPLAPETILPNINKVLISGLTGTAGGAVLGGGLKAAGMGISGAGKIFSKKVKDLYFSLASKRTNIDKSEVKLLFEELQDIERHAILRIKNPKLSISEIEGTKEFENLRFSTDINNSDIDDFARVFAETLDNAAEESKKFYNGKYKAIDTNDWDVLQLFPNERVNERSYMDILDEAKNILGIMKERPGKYLYTKGKNGLLNIMGRMSQQIKQIEAQRSIAGGVRKQSETRTINQYLNKQIFNALNEAKEDISNLVKYDKTISKSDQPTIYLLKQLRRRIKDTLLNEDYFGEYSREFGLVNIGYSEFQYTSKNIQKVFGRKTITREGTVKHVTDAKKVARFLKNINTDKLGHGRETVEELIDAMDFWSTWAPLKQIEALKNVSFNDLGKYTILGDEMGGLAKIKAIYPTLDALAKRSALQNISLFDRPFSVLDLSAGLGGFAITGAPHIGLAAVAATQMGKSPAYEASVINFIRKKSTKLLNRIKDIPTNVIAMRGVALAPSLIQKYYDDNKLDDANINDIIKDLNNAKGIRPEHASNMIDTLTAPFVLSLPNTFGALQTGASRAIDFLITKTPDISNIDDWMIDKGGNIKGAELTKFKRYYAYVMNPNLILDDFSNGMITEEGIEVLNQVYPGIYSQLINEISDAVTDINIPYQTRIKLMSIVGMTPNNISKIQSVFIPKEQNPPQKQKKGRKLTRGTIKDMNKRYSTAAQRTLD